MGVLLFSVDEGGLRLWDRNVVGAVHYLSRTLQHLATLEQTTNPRELLTDSSDRRDT